MAEELLQTTTVNANTTPAELEIPELASNAGVVYLFEGGHTQDLELVSSFSDTDGLTIPSGRRWISGPHRAESGRRMRYLYASSSTSVTVQVIRDDHSSFQHGPADNQISTGQQPASGSIPVVLAANDGTTVGDVDIEQIEIPGDGQGTDEVERQGAALKTYINGQGSPVGIRSRPISGTPSVHLTGGSLQFKEQVKANPGEIVKVAAWIDGQASSATYWLQLWDGEPAGGGSPELRWRTPIKHSNGKDSIAAVDFAPDGLEPFGTDLWVATSTARNSFSAPPTGYSSYRVIYQ